MNFLIGIATASAFVAWDWKRMSLAEANQNQKSPQPKLNILEKLHAK